MLSGCDTLRGKGAMSMARAFRLVAGAGSVVASLWNIDSERTTELMREFYTRLYERGGVTIAEAMRHAMLESIQRDQCPSVWAAFLLTGA